MSKASKAKTEAVTYANSGVDVDAADDAVNAIRDLVASTTNVAGALGAIGGFGGLFEIPSGYRRPVLVASTDGVGTKMAVAVAAGRLSTVGIDLVAMSVDDLVCCGAKPLAFLDYQLFGKIDPALVTEVMTGIAEGCRYAGCAIIGGEMAEHAGLLEPGELDVAGFAIGIVEHDQILNGKRDVRSGDVVIGIASPGLRSNGYSLARRVLLEIGGRSLSSPAWSGATHSLADELLRPSLIYTPAVLDVLAASEVHGIAHITGGGMPGNIVRILSDNLDAKIDRNTWETPRIFDEIQQLGAISQDEMLRAFNLGIGMVIVAPESEADAITNQLSRHDHHAVVIGQIVSGTGQVLVA